MYKSFTEVQAKRELRDGNQYKLDQNTRQSARVVRSALEFPAGRPVATKCPPVSSRSSFSFGSGWRLLFYKGSKVIILEMIFRSSAIIKAIVHTLANLPLLVMAPTDSKLYFAIWFQMYYKWLPLEFLCRGVIGRQLGFPLPYFNHV